MPEQIKPAPENKGDAGFFHYSFYLGAIVGFVTMHGTVFAHGFGIQGTFFQAI